MRNIDSRTIEYVQQIVKEFRSAAPNPGGAPSETEGGGMTEVDVSVCVPALSVMMKVCLRTAGIMVGIAEALTDWRIGV